MKHVIIGTAGHVDHGKTLLTRALTGKDTDTLAEEKKRGITIKNGFAEFVLPNGENAGVIDVPGHERFVKNMIAGAFGMDVVLMVIAADEGMMPQTSEHIDILGLLGVKRGIIVYSKADMVSQEELDQIKADTEKRLEGTFLEGADSIAVSAVTGQGIDELKALIARTVEKTDQRKRDIPFYMPIDRVFSLHGHGTIVTGTLLGGTIHGGDDAFIYTRMRDVRVKNIESFGEQLDTVYAGMRVALNITGAKSEVEPGDVIAKEGSMIITDLMDVRLELVEGFEGELFHNARVHFYHGTTQAVAKVRLLEADVMSGGDEGLAQLVFDKKIAVRNSDRFIIRFFSPVITIGGGSIIDAAAIQHKRKREEVNRRLEMLGDESFGQRLLRKIQDGDRVFVATTLANDENIAPAQMAEEIDALEKAGYLIILKRDKGSDGGDVPNVRFISRDLAERLMERIRKLLEEYHENHPLEDGLNLGEFRRFLNVGGKSDADLVVKYFISEGELKVVDSMVSLFEFKVKLSKDEQRMKDKLISYYSTCGFKAPDAKALDEKFKSDHDMYKKVSARMRKTGELIVLTPGACVLKKYHDKALEELRRMEGDITIANFKEVLGVSRKYAQMYLEYWDRTAVTRRVGDAHILRNGKS